MPPTATRRTRVQISVDSSVLVIRHSAWVNYSMRLLKHMRVRFLTDKINKKSEKSILIHAHAPNRESLHLRLNSSFLVVFLSF